MTALRSRSGRRHFPLLRATAEVLNAANAVRPLGREGYVTLPVFAFGWPTGEATPVVVGASMLDAARRGLRGDFAGRRGRVALALTATAWGLLGYVYARNARSQDSFEGPLRETLGADYESVIAEERRRRPHGVLRTSWARRQYVQKTSVVRYGPHRQNVADVWRRADLPRDGRAPVLLQVPGGAWAIGMRRPQAYPLMSELAERGWICVSMAYRVSPRHTWPAHIVDVKRALAWVKENIAEYGGDPDFVAITGGSAGGHLTALAALTPNDPQWQPGFEDADTSVVAAVPIYGRYDWFTRKGAGRPEFIAILQRYIVKKRFAEHRDVYLEASPITKVRSDAPPFFVLHGADDSIIPVREGRDFVAALKSVSTNTVAYSEIPHAQHAFDFFGSPHGHFTATAVAHFLDWVRGRS
ncbi:alpha/beta hydrolase [Mycolicibacterium sp. 050158]|uniref:alpha/beta hydrolase n=1 Tax=Mycolicibacterium sp. 050158 TaxID=3090602 RepID=UPI00299DC97F|nr:alpha/beta hydrolase [Mycolicibacterium sp. 050158]MDX1892269.1 alpha/beta hydrolase [Mycolicibacterium sp. 050158]